MAGIMRSSTIGDARALQWVVGSAIVLVIVSILGGVALMLFAARSLDHIESLDERQLVDRTIQRGLERMTHELTSATVWDEAYTATTPVVDMAWADINYADYYHRYFNHDLSFAMRDGQVVYASQAGARVSPRAIGALPGDARGLVDEVLAKAAKARAAGRLNLEGVSTAAALVKSGDEIYLVAASDVVAETPRVAASRHAPPIVIITARRISATFIRGMQEDLAVPGLTLTAKPSASPSVPLHDARGVTIGALSWTPANPGMSLLKAALPAIVAVFLVLTLASLVLFRRVAETLDRMARGRESLVVAKEQAEAANVAKTQFLANMSHEIRTPLNGVLGMAQIMESDALSDRQRERLAVIEESGNALLALLNSILDMARLETGAIRLRREAFDLGALVDSSCAVFSGAAVSKGIKLCQALTPESLGAWVGDPLRLRQVLGNLVANAVKFTDSGTVRVHVEESALGLRFEVSDTGIGVAPQDQLRLFKMFSQVDSSSTRSHEGSGLGLAICHDLVELMGGAIGMRSVPGEGSTFFFDLPLQRAPAERPTLRIVGRA
uniref:histidine kinase n=1 Tax=Caulobacter sp. (strain K31) TaxID=366602 RepID=B0SWN8_CAUSK